MRPVRAGLLLLAAGQLLTGGWALAAPASFYRSFPGSRPGWVAADGPFNHHLVIDAGAGFLATGTGLLLAAVWLRRSMSVVALAAYLAHAVPHLAYHARHPATALPAVDQVLSPALLAAGAALASALLVASVRRTTARIRPHAAETASQRVSPIDGRPRNPLLLAAFAAAGARLGTVPTSWRVLARVPRVAIARVLADAAHQRTRIVPAHLGALAQLRAATLVECAFCIDILAAAAVGDGVRHDQVRDLTRWPDSGAFDADERLALALADAITATPARVADELRAALVTRFGQAGVVELATAIGHENARARANCALGIAPQGFAAAADCPLPAAVPS